MARLQSMAFLALALPVVSCAHAYTDLPSAYAALKFDPSAPGNAVIVFFSDQHMCLAPEGLPANVVTTNLDYRLLNTVNAMIPPPAKIICSGDVSSSLSPAPGVEGLFNSFVVIHATNEMALFAAEMKKFTNVPESQKVWIPGNHDQSPSETNAETFCRIFPEMPTYQSFDIAGVKFFLLNSGNYGEPSEAEEIWLRQEVARTSPTQEVAVVTHQPPFHGAVVHRGVARLLRDVFGDWQSRWWVFDGHEHWPGVEVYAVGQQNVSQITVGPASTNTFMGYSYGVGYMILCISNGIAGQIYYRYRTEDFAVVQNPDWANPARFIEPFEDTPGVLWRRLKTSAPSPEMLFSWALDSIDWWAYPVELRWAIPLGQHANLATHFLLLATGVTPTSVFEFSTDLDDWVQSPIATPTNSVYWITIPAEMTSLPTIYGRFRTFDGNNWVAGWGLATTNTGSQVRYPQLKPIADQEVVAGGSLTLTVAAVDPYAPPDVLKYALVAGPPDAILDERTGMFMWQPPLSHRAETVTVEVNVSDGYSPPMSVTRQFQIKVLPPAPPPPGNYQGIFYDTNNPAAETSGAFQYTLSASKRSFSGKVLLGKSSYRFSGVFSETHDALVKTVKTADGRPLKLSLQLITANNQPGVVGTIGNGSWTLPLRGHRAEYSSKNVAPQAGRYTLVLRNHTTHILKTAPDGCGFGSVLVSRYGRVTLSGFAADGRTISQSSSLSKGGHWPLYISLYRNHGCLVGWLRLTNTTKNSIDGEDIRWVKKDSRDKFYPKGFTNNLRAIGSPFSAAPNQGPGASSNGLPFTEAVALLAGGDLFSQDGLAVSTLVKVTVTTRNTLATEQNPEKLRLSLARTTGTISGSFINPTTGLRVPIRGKVLQEQNCALGYFLSGNSSGSFSGFFSLTKPGQEHQ